MPMSRRALSLLGCATALGAAACAPGGDEPGPAAIAKLPPDLADALRAGEPRQLCTVDDLAARGVLPGGQRSVVDPAAHRVVADPEQLGGLTDPDLRHRTRISASAAESMG